MEMFCSKCSENLVEGTKFCPKCGTNAEGNNNSVNVNPVPVQKIATGGLVVLVLAIIGIIYPLVMIINESIKQGNIMNSQWGGLIVLMIISHIVLKIGIISILKPKLKPSMQTGLWIGFGILLFMLPLFAIVFLALVLMAQEQRNNIIKQGV
jgi:hypothetical protein